MPVRNLQDDLANLNQPRDLSADIANLGKRDLQADLRGLEKPRDFQNLLGILPDRPDFSKEVRPSTAVDFMRPETKPIIQTEAGVGRPDIQQPVAEKPITTEIPSPINRQFPIQSLQRTTPTIGKPVEKTSVLTEQLLTAIDELTGTPKSQFADPNEPLTPAQQTFAEQPGAVKAVSPIVNIAARSGVVVSTFLPNLFERLVDPGTEAEKSTATNNLKAFLKNVPFSGDIIDFVVPRLNILAEEAGGIAKLAGNAPIILDYITLKAQGIEDPTTMINANSPLVKAYEGVTGKPFIEYYKEVINEFFDAKETLLFGTLIGVHGIGAILKKSKATPKTVAKQAKEVSKVDKAQKPTIELERKADIITEQIIKEQVGEKGKVIPLPEPAKKLPPHLQKIVDEQAGLKPRFEVKDVTPEGFGIPAGETVKGRKFGSLLNEFNADQNKIMSNIKEGETLLKNTKLSNEKRTSIIEQVNKQKNKLKESLTKEQKVTQFVNPEVELFRPVTKPVTKLAEPATRPKTVKLEPEKKPGEVTKIPEAKPDKIEQPLIEQAKKFKTADEFVDSRLGVATDNTYFIRFHNKEFTVQATSERLARKEAISRLVADKDLGGRYPSEGDVIIRSHPRNGLERINKLINEAEKIVKRVQEKADKEKTEFSKKILNANKKHLIELKKQRSEAQQLTDIFNKSKLPDGKAKVPTPPIKPLVEPSKAVKPTAKPVKLAEPAKTDRIVGLSKVESDNIRKHTGLNELPPPERITFEQSLSEAKKQGLDKSALTTAEQVLKENRPITDAEHSGMVIKAGELLDTYDKAVSESSKFIEKGNKGSAIIERTKANIALDQLDRLTEATRSGRREAARTLSIGRMKLSRDNYDIVQVLDRATVAKGSKLTTTERAKYEDLVQEHKEAVKRNEILETKYQKVLAEQEIIVGEKVTKILAQRETIRGKSKGAKDKILTQQKNIKKKLDALGFRINDISGVTAEASFLIGQLAVNYIKGGITKGKESSLLDAVVKQVLRDVPEITRRDVIQAVISKDPRKNARKRSQTHKTITRIKTQSRLLLEVEKKTKVLPETAPEIKSLQNTLKQINKDIRKTVLDSRRLEKSLETLHNLQDQLDNHFRAVKEKRKPDPAEIVNIKENIKNLRKDMRLEDTKADLIEQLRTGDFKETKLRPAPKLPKDLNRSQVEIRQLRKKIRGQIQQQIPPTAFTRIDETLNTFRTLKATADMSYTFRQGLMLLVNHPVIGTKAFGKAFQSIFSEHKAEALDNALRSVDHHYIRVNAGLYLPEIRDVVLSVREEAFMSNFLERIPVIGHIVKASERHMITGLNHLRAGAFDQFLEKYPNATLVELKAWAEWVNVTSGRGTMNAKVARNLSRVLFAPRFAYSRIQTPGLLFKYWSEPRVRNAIAKDMAAIGGLGITTLGLASLAGLEVGTDPRSSDFGKIKFGNTRIDIFAGYQQPMRLIIRAGTLASDKAGLTGRHLPYSEKEWDALDAFGRFVKYKIAPSVAIPFELSTGKTVIGEETTPSETAIRSITPIVYEDIGEAYREYGVLGSVVFGGLSFVGTATATYQPSESAMRRRLRKLQEEGKIEQMEQERTQWNMQQPTNRIVNVATVKQSNFETRYNKIVKDMMENKEGASDRLKQLKKDFPEFEGDIKTEKEIEFSNREKRFTNEYKDIVISHEKGLDVRDKLRNLKRRFPEYRQFRGFKDKILSTLELRKQLKKRLKGK